MVKTLKEYLENGGIVGKTFIDNYNHLGMPYEVVKIVAPTTNRKTSDFLSEEIVLEIRYGFKAAKAPTKTALRNHLGDLEVKVEACFGPMCHLSYPDSSIK